jgi:cytochrome c556
MQIKLKTFVPVVLLVSAISVTAVTAHSMSTGNADADKRIGLMKELGSNMKAIADVAKGEAAYSPALNDNAKRINEIAKMMPDLFPAGSDTDKDRAKPEIWSNGAEFSAAAMDFEKASAALVAAVSTGDQGKIGAALGGTGKTCGGCHKPFREPKH